MTQSPQITRRTILSGTSAAALTAALPSVPLSAAPALHLPVRGGAGVTLRFGVTASPAAPSIPPRSVGTGV